MQSDKEVRKVSGEKRPPALELTKKSKDAVLAANVETIQTRGLQSPSSPASPDEEFPDLENRFVQLMEKLDAFESVHGNLSAYYYMAGFAVILVFANILRMKFVSEETGIPAIQVIFLACLISFLMNYYIIREAVILPYIEHEEDAFYSKCAGGGFLLSIVSLYYSMTFVSQHTVATIWFLAPLISLTAERIYSNISYTEKEQLAFVVGFVGTVLITKPFTGSCEGDNCSWFWGIIFAILSVLAFTASGNLVRKLHQYNHFTLNHILSMFVILFLPLFFPMQGVVKLSLIDWIVMLIIGVASFFGSILFVRAFQLERSARVYVTLSGVLVLLVLQSTIFRFGIFGGILSFIGGLIIIASIVVVIMNTTQIIQVPDAFYTKMSDAKELEMALIPKHSVAG
jgi:hypothetical protein